MNEITLLGLPSGPELFIVLAVILLLFGSTKLPKLARSLGASVTEFKKGIKSGGDGQSVGDGTNGDDDPKKVNAPEADSASESGSGKSN